MVWLVYENSDEITQLFAGCLIILGMTVVLLGSLYFWVREKFFKK